MPYIVSIAKIRTIGFSERDLVFSNRLQWSLIAINESKIENVIATSYVYNDMMDIVGLRLSKNSIQMRSKIHGDFKK